MNTCARKSLLTPHAMLALVNSYYLPVSHMLGQFPRPAFAFKVGKVLLECLNCEETSCEKFSCERYEQDPRCPNRVPNSSPTAALFLYNSICPVRDPERWCVCGSEQVPLPHRHHPLAGHHEEPSR